MYVMEKKLSHVCNKNLPIKRRLHDNNIKKPYNKPWRLHNIPTNLFNNYEQHKQDL